MQGNLVPIVIEKTGRGERSYDIYSRLLKDRIIFIGPIIDDYTSSLVIAQILFLMSDNKNQDINIVGRECFAIQPQPSRRTACGFHP